MSDNLNDEMEQVLSQMIPRGAPGQLREAVMDDVSRELSAKRRPRWDRRCTLVAVGLLLFAVGLNAWVVRFQHLRTARLYGPSPVPTQVAEIVDTVASITDAHTANWVRQRLTASRRARQELPTPSFELNELLSELELTRKDTPSDEREEEHEVDRNRRSGAHRDSIDCPWDSLLEFWRTA